MGLAEAKKILADSDKHSRRLVEQAQEIVEKFTQKEKTNEVSRRQDKNGIWWNCHG